MHKYGIGGEVIPPKNDKPDTEKNTKMENIDDPKEDKRYPAAVDLKPTPRPPDPKTKREDAKKTSGPGSVAKNSKPQEIIN